MRLLCEVFREGAAAPVASHEVLNEVVLSRGAAPWLSKIEVYERDTLLTRVQVRGWWLCGGWIRGALVGWLSVLKCPRPN